MVDKHMLCYSLGYLWLLAIFHALEVHEEADQVGLVACHEALNSDDLPIQLLEVEKIDTLALVRLAELEHVVAEFEIIGEAFVVEVLFAIRIFE